MRKDLIVLVTVSLIIIGCSSSNKTDIQNENYSYINKSTTECEKIVFSCPQFYQEFYDEDGCGCKEGIIDYPNKRSLGYLVNSYLKQKTLKVNEGSFVDSEFILLGAKESGSELSYQIWAETHEYYNDEDGKVVEGASYSGPIILEITQTGKSYIIHGHETYSLDSDEARIRKDFTTEAQEIILGDKRENLDKTVEEILNDFRVQAEVFLGSPDLSNPSEDTEEVSE